MNVLAVTAFILVELCFAGLILLVARSGMKKSVNRTFLYFLLAFAAWAAANFLSNVTDFSYETVLLLNRLLFIVSVVALYALLVFVTSVIRLKTRRWMRYVSGLAAFAAVATASTPLVVHDIFFDKTGNVGVHFGPLMTAYFILIVFLSAGILSRLAKGLTQTNVLERNKAKVLFLSIGIAIGMVLVTNVFVPLAFGNFALTSFGLFAGMFIISGISYGIVRHGMFDIKRAAVRSATYSLLLLALAASYFVLAFVLSTFFGTLFAGGGQVVSGFIISLILALIFQPIRQFFDKATNKLFYKDQYTSDEFFAAVNRILVSTTDLRTLLSKVANLTMLTLKSEQTFFFINTAEARHSTVGTKEYSKLPASDAKDLESYFAGNFSILQASLLESDHHIRRLLLSHRIELVMPLLQGKAVIGLMCLGEHLTSGYSQRDLRVLETVSDELAIAIQNALSVDEVKDLNANLEQRIDSATKELRASNAQLQRLDEAKDEFISMASHQLRTPLTSIKGYISMLMDGDIGPVSKDQKHLLEETFMSSERMVRLISDFLNVSRLQTGKFVIEKHPVNLAVVVDHEVSALVPNAATRGLKFSYKMPKNIPMMSLDESKIQQVIMNFCDNAIYYSKEGSTIKVSLSLTKRHVELTVKDTGIGVPLEEQEQLFNKFFRATNARKQRPDGTGVGLFLAKKVIDAHHGQIIFESKPGKGSTFGFRLPLDKS